MKKIFVTLCGMIAIYSASAQISAGLFSNYTMYKQNFKENAVGAGVRLYYDAAEKYSISLGFVYGAPVKFQSQVVLQNNMDPNDTETRASEIRYKFKTFALQGNYNFIGDQETAGKFYGLFGAGLVLVSFDEKIKEDYDHAAFTPLNQIEGKENGFTINLGLGGEYKLNDRLSVFGEGAIALPANKVGDTYVENYIPTHLTVNLGLKLSLSGGGDY